MSVRIYTLAKDLKLDSKELVDICTKAGIPGKGSALASLSDEEAEKVKAFLAGGSAKPSRSKSAHSPMPVPPRRAPAVEKMPVIVTKRKAAPRPAPLAPLRKKEAPVPVAPEVPDSDALPAEPEIDPTISPIGDDPMAVPSEAPGGLTGSTGLTGATEAVADPIAAGPVAIRREDYIGPASSVGKMPVLGESVKLAGQNRGESARGGSTGRMPAEGGLRVRPAIKLAPLPSPVAPKQTKKTKKDEPAPQKPDMKLPADIVRATSTGQSRPLAAHLRRAERVAEAEKRQKQLGTTPAAEGRLKEGEARGRGRVKKGRDGAEGEKGSVLYSREQRQLRRSRPNRKDGDRPIRRITRRHKRTGTNTAAPRKDRISLELPCTLREFSEAAGVPAAQIQRILMDEGVMATINAEIDPELVEFIAAEIGADVDFTYAQTLEEKILTAIRDSEDDPADLAPRAPIVTFLGHVDHGKTSLLDRIIGLDVVSGESGGITQHIRAYEIHRDGRQIAFVDTPGHEAFTEMRARGANVTDIAVLVVAADDGVMPQTEEAISHARAADVPIVVALNKIDLPGVDVDRIYQQLSTNELLPSEWGGDVEVIKTSAQTGVGIDDLLETVLAVAELNEYKANPNRDAFGTCLEATQEADRGVIAKMIVQNGTLRLGDVVVAGHAFGRVKAMIDTLDSSKQIDEAGPSVPVNLIGFDVAPAAGEHFYVLDDVTKAREIAGQRAAATRQAELSGRREHVTLETLFDRLEGVEEIQTLNVIIRADVRGSIEAIRKEFEKLDHPEVKIKILQATVGGVTEADVTLADATDAIIIGFNVVPDEGARQLSDLRGVQIRRYEVIYKITDDLKAALEGMLKPDEREVTLGRALVQRAYKISRVGTIAGCRVLSGTIHRNARTRVIRESTIIGDYPIDTLRREKDDAKEVREGLECGIKLSGFNDIKEADVLEVYRVEEIGRSFDD